MKIMTIINSDLARTFNRQTFLNWPTMIEALFALFRVIVKVTMTIIFNGVSF